MEVLCLEVFNVEEISPSSEGQRSPEKEWQKKTSLAAFSVKDKPDQKAGTEIEDCSVVRTRKARTGSRCRIPACTRASSPSLGTSSSARWWPQVHPGLLQQCLWEAQNKIEIRQWNSNCHIGCYYKGNHIPRYLRLPCTFHWNVKHEVYSPCSCMCTKLKTGTHLIVCRKSPRSWISRGIRLRIDFKSA